MQIIELGHVTKKLISIKYANYICFLNNRFSNQYNLNYFPFIFNSNNKDYKHKIL